MDDFYGYLAQEKKMFKEADETGVAEWKSIFAGARVTS